MGWVILNYQNLDLTKISILLVTTRTKNSDFDLDLAILLLYNSVLCNSSAKDYKSRRASPIYKLWNFLFWYVMEIQFSIHKNHFCRIYQYLSIEPSFQQFPKCMKTKSLIPSDSKGIWRKSNFMPLRGVRDLFMKLVGFIKNCLELSSCKFDKIIRIEIGRIMNSWGDIF